MDRASAIACLRAMMRRSIVVALAGAVGCGPSKECRERTAELEASVNAIPRGGETLFAITHPPSSHVLVELDAAIEAADDIESGDVAIMFVGKRGGSILNRGAVGVGTIPEATKDLQQHLADQRDVLMLPSGDTPWVHIATLLEAMRELERTHVSLLFVRDVPIPPPPASSIAAELATLRQRSAGRFAAAAELAEQTFASCEPTAPFFERARTTEMTLPQFTSELGDALRACGCQADLTAVHALLHFWFAPDFIPAIVRIELAPKRSVAPERIVLDRDLTWVEANKTIVAARDRPMAFGTN